MGRNLEVKRLAEHFFRLVGWTLALFLFVGLLYEYIEDIDEYFAGFVFGSAVWGLVWVPGYLIAAVSLLVRDSAGEWTDLATGLSFGCGLPLLLLFAYAIPVCLIGADAYLLIILIPGIIHSIIGVINMRAYSKLNNKMYEEWKRY